MGPYMSPIPINSSLGMALSLAIAFTVTPWLALKLMREHGAPMASGHAVATSKESGGSACLHTMLTPFLNSARKRWLLLGGILVRARCR
jgi:multidrug efflux pump subunit AcrB